MGRHDPRGRRKAGGRFALLPLTVLKDPAVTQLDPAVRWVLVALAGQFSGGNNGGLALTRAVAKEYGIRSSDTLQRAMAQLCEVGLVERTYPGSYRPPAPARYALSWHPLNQTEWTRAARTATNAYRKTEFGDRSPVPTAPTTGPVNGADDHGKAPLAPTTGPISAPPWDRSPDTSRVLPLRDVVKAAA